MPYCFSEGDPGWDEMMAEDDTVHPLKPAQFHYLTPPASGGHRDPVPFSDQAPPPALPLGQPRAVRLLEWLVRWNDRRLERRFRRAGQHQLAESMARQRQYNEQIAERRKRLGQTSLALVVVALREIGARRAYCRYDGGNDEGFAWFDHVELDSGERLASDATAERLAGTGLRARCIDAGLWSEEQEIRTRELLEKYGQQPRRWNDSALDWFADEC